MKAFLLAAGVGSRLKPYTDSIPKCLIPIHGKPLLQIWLELLDRHKVSAVLINTHHHSEKLSAFIAGIKPTLRVQIETSYEPVLLGSAGTLAANRTFVDDGEDFIIAYADNLTQIDLLKMAAFHEHIKTKGGILTMGLFRAPNPGQCGIAELDPENRVVGFIEKPQNPLGNLANSGIYIASSRIFDFIPQRDGAVIDIGFDLLPLLVGKMFGYEIREYLRDIGTPESYHQALNEWKGPAF